MADGSGGGRQLSSEADEAQLKAKQFRETFGFDAGHATLVAAESDSSRFPNLDYGVPLTQAEADELARRGSVQHSKAPVVVFLQENVRSFGGSYTDQLAGGLPVFLFSDDARKHEPEIRGRLPAGTAFRVERVNRSLAQLDQLQDEIDRSWAALKRDGIDVNMTAIDVKTNAVVVGIKGTRADDHAALEERFGGGIVVQESSAAESDACQTVDNCRPIKGGLDIRSAANNGGCTSGFVVRRSENSGLAVLTAGHCIEFNGTLGTDWRHNGSKFGDALYETWRDNNTADIGLIDIDTDEVITIKNETYVGGAAGSPNIRIITDWDPATSHDQGDQACRFGITTRWECGVIKVEDATRESCVNNNQICKTIFHTVETDVDASGGDSGAAFIHYSIGTTRIGLGTHVHSTDGYSVANGKGWYSPIDWGKWTYQADFQLNYMICVTSSC